MPSLDWPLSGVARNTSSPHKSSKTSSPPIDSNIARFEQTKMLRSHGGGLNVMLYVASPTTSRSHTAHSPSKPLIRPFNGGKGNLHQGPPHFVPHGHLAQISIVAYVSSCDNGIHKSWHVRFHATHRLSKRCSSNMPQYLINFVTTNRPFWNVPLTNQPIAAVTDGPLSSTQR